MACEGSSRGGDKTGSGIGAHCIDLLTNDTVHQDNPEKSYESGNPRRAKGWQLNSWDFHPYLYFGSSLELRTCGREEEGDVLELEEFGEVLYCTVFCKRRQSPRNITTGFKASKIESFLFSPLHIMAGMPSGCWMLIPRSVQRRYWLIAAKLCPASILCCKLIRILK